MTIGKEQFESALKNSECHNKRRQNHRKGRLDGMHVFQLRIGVAYLGTQEYCLHLRDHHTGLMVLLNA
eukprot:4165302-Amphidinium_carterae.1